ncbi:MAG: hypothetical protein DVB23_000760 [Verrucomicrobia bacterium]|nr:MAG: hypothetical protein DVB23_000760 [Verrucomicrobiota bacterium]
MGDCQVRAERHRLGISCFAACFGFFAAVPVPASEPPALDPAALWSIGVLMGEHEVPHDLPEGEFDPFEWIAGCPVAFELHFLPVVGAHPGSSDCLFATVDENSPRLAASRCVHDCSFKRRQYVSIAPGKNNRRITATENEELKSAWLDLVSDRAKQPRRCGVRRLRKRGHMRASSQEVGAAASRKTWGPFRGKAGGSPT